jgi:hypothetical protein
MHVIPNPELGTWQNYNMKYSPTDKDPKQWPSHKGTANNTSNAQYRRDPYLGMCTMQAAPPSSHVPQQLNAFEGAGRLHTNPILARSGRAFRHFVNPLLSKHPKQLGLLRL